MRIYGLLILYFLNPIVGWSQPDEIITDLKDQWMVMKGDHLKNYEGEAVHTIHLWVSDQFKGGTISITTPDEFTLFVNGKLQIRTRSAFSLNVDSLLSMKGGVPLLSVFQKGNVRSINTALIRKGYSANDNILRASSQFNDFVILSSLFLFGFFIILFRSNNRLTLDYLNVTKIFSIQEREDAIVTGRIGSSVNLLFFVFISLLLGLLLLIIFNLGPPVLRKISVESALGALGWWLLVSLFILVFLIIKLAIVWITSSLFGFKGQVRFQFFNFIRSLYVASALMGLILLCYYVLKLENPEFFYFLLSSACGFMIISTFFFYLKLMRRISSTIFHLFFYLCGSEIIILMVIIKVLLN